MAGRASRRWSARGPGRPAAAGAAGGCPGVSPALEPAVSAPIRASGWPRSRRSTSPPAYPLAPATATEKVMCMTIHASACSCLTRVCAVDIAFAEHLDLLDLHGRAAVASLAQLGPTDTLPPRGVPAAPGDTRALGDPRDLGLVARAPRRALERARRAGVPRGHADGGRGGHRTELDAAGGPAPGRGTGPADRLLRPSGDDRRGGAAAGARGDRGRARRQPRCRARPLPRCTRRSRPTASTGRWTTGPSRTRTSAGSRDRHCCAPPTGPSDTGRSWLVSCGQDRRGDDPSCVRAAHGTSRPSWSRARTTAPAAGGCTTTQVGDERHGPATRTPSGPCASRSTTSWHRLPAAGAGGAGDGCRRVGA